MRLMRVGARGAERPVVLDADDGAYDISPVAPRIDDAFLAGDGLAMVREALVAEGLRQVDITWERVGAPIERPGTVVCIGLNHTNHAAETGAAVPSEPVVFLTASNIVVPTRRRPSPPGRTQTDWEVEPVVVLGRVARYPKSPAAAYDVIAGYAVSHDESEREFQLDLELDDVSGPQVRVARAPQGHARWRPRSHHVPALDGLGRQRQTVRKA
jgi:2,4-didehydro-3-deoxy-L-rhamnonate hydrolase